MKWMSWIFRTALLVSLALSGCIPHPEVAAQVEPVAGQIYELSHGVTMMTVNAIINGTALDLPYLILTDGAGKYVITWHLGAQGWAFWVWDSTSSKIINNLRDVKAIIGYTNGWSVASKDAEDIVDLLAKQGWKTVGPAAIPAVVKAGIASLAMAPLQTLPTFIFATTTMPWDVEGIYNTINPPIQQ